MNFNFGAKKEVVTFKSAQDAYSYLFLKLQSDGVDIEQASARAYKFSIQYAEQMSLPIKIEVKEKGIRGILQDVKIVSDFIKENPTIWEIGKPIVLGAVSAIAGGAIGSEVANSKSEVKLEPIVYEEDKKEDTKWDSED